MRSPQTHGDEGDEGTSTFHDTFSSGPNLRGGRAVSETPQPFGPRNMGQFSEERPSTEIKKTSQQDTESICFIALGMRSSISRSTPPGRPMRLLHPRARKSNGKRARRTSIAGRLRGKLYMMSQVTPRGTRPRSRCRPGPLPAPQIYDALDAGIADREGAVALNGTAG